MMQEDTGARRRHAWSPFERWLKEYSPLMTLALLIATIAIGWNVRSTYDDEVSIHASDCAYARLRTTDIETFWQSKGTLHKSHARHENAAAALWATIVGDFARAKITDPSLARDIATVSATWTGLASDDSQEADIDSTYVSTLQADYNKSCGSVPTPRPITTP